VTQLGRGGSSPLQRTPKPAPVAGFGVFAASASAHDASANPPSGHRIDTRSCGCVGAALGAGYAKRRTMEHEMAERIGESPPIAPPTRHRHVSAGVACSERFGELTGGFWRHIGMRVAVALVVLLVFGGGARCGSTGVECSGPCPTGTHHWTAHEIARDMASENFPPHANARDHLYRISCRITDAGARAVCVGRRRFGAHPGERVVAHALLRDNGSWDLLCQPNPSTLCDSVQVREQRANPITS
jgi:hypothetical protein